VAPRALYTVDADGLTLTVKVVPKAARDAVLGSMPTPDGTALKVTVTAPPDRGKANAAVIDLIAAAFGLAPRDVALIGGAKDRRKVLRVHGDPAALIRIAQQWVT
jgi:uncharacterized protein (TIGR00251 family)